jgi:hypothetical protein
MTSMMHTARDITGGVDTHGLTHHAAVIDSIGRHLADQEFPATIRGYRDLLDWMRDQGTLVAVGVEGTAISADTMVRAVAERRLGMTSRFEAGLKAAELRLAPVRASGSCQLCAGAGNADRRCGVSCEARGLFPCVLGRVFAAREQQRGG